MLDESRKLAPRALDELATALRRSASGGEEEWIVHEHHGHAATESMGGRDRVHIAGSFVRQGRSRR